LKAHFSQLARLLNIDSVAELFNGARPIRIRRRDLVRQAISYYTAEETGVWSTTNAGSLTETPSPAYNGEAISQHLSAILAADAGWNAFWPIWIRLFWTPGTRISLPRPTRYVARCAPMSVSILPPHSISRALVCSVFFWPGRRMEARFCAEHTALVQNLASQLVPASTS
jgi:hypothetical protein